MNSSYLKTTLSFIAGFVVGGAVMFKMATDRFNKQLEQMDLYYATIDDERNQEYKNMRDSMEEYALTGEIENIPYSKDYSNVVIDIERKKPSILDVIQKYKGEVVEDITDPEVQYELKNTQDDYDSQSVDWKLAHNNGVVEITANQFYNNEVEFEQISLTYYDLDNILVDDKNELIPNPETLLGYTLIQDTSDKHIFYARNFDKRLDFEVVRTDESYYESLVSTVGSASVTAKNAQPTVRKKRVSKKEE